MRRAPPPPGAGAGTDPSDGVRVAGPVPTGLALAIEVPQVVVEVDLHGVPRRGVELLLVPPVVALHLAPYDVVRGRHVATGERLGDPRRLRLGDRHHRTDGLHEADEVEAGEVGVDGALPQRQLVVVRRHQLGVEERERHPVAGGPHDEVRRGRGAVDEDDPVAVEPLDARPRRHRTGVEALADLVGLHRVRLPGLVGRRRQAVLRHAAGVRRPDAQPCGGHPPRQPARQGDLVARLAEEELAQHPLGRGAPTTWSCAPRRTTRPRCPSPSCRRRPRPRRVRRAGHRSGSRGRGSARPSKVPG